MCETCKNNSGFGTIELPIAIAVAIMLGLAGWSVYKSNNKKADNHQSQNKTVAQNSSAESKEVGSDNSMLDPTDLLEQYNLPQDWKKKECKKGHIAIIPPHTHDPNCDADQPYVPISIVILDNFDYIDPENCALTKTKMKERYSSAYECSDIIVNGNKGIRQSQKDDENGFAGEATYTSYIFPASGKLLTITYSDVKSYNDPDYLADFDNFVATLRFQ